MPLKRRKMALIPRVFVIVSMESKAFTKVANGCTYPIMKTSNINDINVL